MSAQATNGGIAIALDIGGTAIKAIAIGRDGELLALERQPTPSGRPPDEVADLIVETIRRLLARSAVGRWSRSRVSACQWRHSSPRPGSSRRRPTSRRRGSGMTCGSGSMASLPSAYFFALDTFAATIGEAHYGAGRGVDDFAYVTVSTGIGAGLFSGGRLNTGGLGWAGGVGHIIVDPNGPRACDRLRQLRLPRNVRREAGGARARWRGDQPSSRQPARPQRENVTDPGARLRGRPRRRRGGDLRVLSRPATTSAWD